ncbi:MAG: YifB family Mg chelatase-like AAA ATPase [Candidatus Pacebacteria bacterium]|nr:YifB family Mg chelatase-like AAA ATPase [Candidatus Paceibacterota bacterium]
MSTAKTYSAHICGLHMETVTVEVDISNGLHSFSVIGLGDRSVDEAKDRISAAIKNTGYISPKQKNQKVVISLAPADTRKEGSSFDLAMALAYLSASSDIEFDYENTLFLGELSLEGKLRKIHGLLPILIDAPTHGFTAVFIPKENEKEASLAQHIIIYPVSSLQEIVEHLMRHKKLIPLQPRHTELHAEIDGVHRYDISHIRGNESSKRALEIAVAGCHNIILYGPPGTGKTMLAQSMASIMPPLSYEQAVEVTSIYSVARILDQGLITHPPFRSPHHTSSAISILGGGTTPHPGEITLAHRGVLFLDEFPEFEQRVIEGLRQPLEERTITVARARGSVTFPAQCIMVASMNPCRCGKGKGNGCACSPRSIERYQRKLSAPVLDRIDIWIQVSKIDYEKLSLTQASSEKTKDIRKRVIQARAVQMKRFHSQNKYYNSEMNAGDIEKYALLEDDARKLLTQSAEKLGVSGRAFHRIIKVARTIADLDCSPNIKKSHILEAIQYRQKKFG